jgi:hypothetical protein
LPLWLLQASHGVEEEKAEILALAAQAKNAHVKEMLEDLANYLNE